MTCWLDEVEARVHTVVDHLASVYPVLLFKVGIEAGLDVVDDRFPTASWKSVQVSENGRLA